MFLLSTKTFWVKRKSDFEPVSTIEAEWDSKKKNYLNWQGEQGVDFWSFNKLFSESRFSDNRPLDIYFNRICLKKYQQKIIKRALGQSKWSSSYNRKAIWNFKSETFAGTDFNDFFLFESQPLHYLTVNCSCWTFSLILRDEMWRLQKIRNLT